MSELNHDLFGNVVPEKIQGVKLSTPKRRAPKVNPNQMYLFATGDELMKHVERSVDAYDDDDGNPGYPMEDLWRQKRRESIKWGYIDQFDKQGIQRPVTIQYDEGPKKFTMGQGHHRVAAAHEINKTRGRNLSIPVVYSNDWDYTNDDYSLYEDDYPFGPGGEWHEFAKNNPPGKWAGLTEEQLENNDIRGERR